MGPLQPNSRELISQLSSVPAPASVPVAPGSVPSSGSKGAGSLGAASLLFNLVSWLGSNIWSDVRMQRQNQQNLQQWQRENAYNSPSAQMQRLRLAGLNPAMVFANGSMMNEAASSPQFDSYPVSSPVQIDPLTAAQIDNLTASAEEARAGAEDKLQSANARKITAAIDGMTYEAMKDNFELYKKSFEAEYQDAISSARMSAMEYYELCWSLAIMFGTDPGSLEVSADSVGYVVPYEDYEPFSFSKDAWDRASSVFKGNQELQIKVQEVEKFLKDLDMEEHKKDKEFWQSLNKAAEDPDNWLARAALYALVLLKQRSGATSFAFNFSKPKVSRVSNVSNRNVIHNNKIWHRHND